LFHSISMIKMSPGFINWLSQFNPDILYLQVSTRDSLIFTQKLIKYLSVPSAIHVMDDWPSTISERGLFRKFWKRKIDGEFRELLAKADLCLSISDAMSDEYYRRYNKYFKPFHNPIEMGRFMQSNQVRTNTPDVFRILYLGRIGFANRNSIFNFAKVISEIKTDKFRITLDIFTSDNDTPFVRKISSIDKTTVNPAVKYDDVPLLLKAFDLLLLPLDFTEDGLKYAQYSIPTKASEYMISGTPVLVYAPGETAISKFCRENECAHCVTEEGDEYIKKAIQLLVSDENYRNKISNKAVKLAGELFDAKKVRKDFQNLLIRLSEREDSIKPGN